MKTVVILLSTLLALARAELTEEELEDRPEISLNRPFIYYPKELEKFIKNPEEIAAYLLENPQYARLDTEAVLGRSRQNAKFLSLVDYFKTVDGPEDIVDFIAPDPRLPYLNDETIKAIVPPEFREGFDTEKVADIIQNPEVKIPMLNKILNSRYEEAPKACPQIAQKEGCPKIPGPEKIPCWSPGEYDVDCPASAYRKRRDTDKDFGLCCFDGCHNTCYKKECRFVNMTYTDTEMQEKCTDQEREECENVPKTECKEVCKDETVMVDTQVPEEKCEMVPVEECRIVEKEEEKCTLEEQPPITYVNHCPPPPANPTCGPNPVNQCWSPGHPDVDCPRNLGPGNWTDEQLFAPCCFNGCSNVCHYTGEVSPCPTKKGPRKCETKERCQIVTHQCGTTKQCKMVQRECKVPAVPPTKTQRSCRMESKKICKEVEVPKPVVQPVPVPPVPQPPTMPEIPTQPAVPETPSITYYPGTYTYETPCKDCETTYYTPEKSPCKDCETTYTYPTPAKAPCKECVTTCRDCEPSEVRYPSSYGMPSQPYQIEGRHLGAWKAWKGAWKAHKKGMIAQHKAHKKGYWKRSVVEEDPEMPEIREKREASKGWKGIWKAQKKAMKAQKKAFKKGYGYQDGYWKRSVEEEEPEKPASKKGDNGKLEKVAQRQKRHFKSKGCKKGCHMAPAYDSEYVEPSYVYNPTPSYIEEPTYTESEVTYTYPERDPVPDSSYTPETTFTEVEPERQPAPHVNLNLTTSFTNPEVTVNLECFYEPTEVCEDIEVAAEDTIGLCEVEECTDIVDPGCQPTEEVCHQVEECTETHIPVCEVCKMVKKPVEECFERPQEKCETIMKTVQVPEKHQKCGQVCEETTEKVCRLVPFTECHPVEVEVERMVPEQVCEWPQ